MIDELISSWLIEFTSAQVWVPQGEVHWSRTINLNPIIRLAKTCLSVDGPMPRQIRRGTPSMWFWSTEKLLIRQVQRACIGCIIVSLWCDIAVENW